MESLYNNVHQFIEKSIEELGVDPELCRGDKQGQWSLTYKNATVWIDLFNYPTNPDKYYFQVMSPLMRIPDRNKEEIYTNILEINYNLYGCAICIKENWLYVINLREAEGLNKSEIDATIDRVAFYSSDYYGKLSFKFEGNWDVNPLDNPSGNN